MRHNSITFKKINNIVRVVGQLDIHDHDLEQTMFRDWQGSQYLYI